MANPSLTRNQREGDEGGALRSVARRGTEVHKGATGRSLPAPGLTWPEKDERAMACILVGTVFALGIFIAGMLGLSAAGQMLAGLSLLAFGVLGLLLFLLREGADELGQVTSATRLRLQSNDEDTRG